MPSTTASSRSSRRAPRTLTARGLDVQRERIAKEAGVGSATLYD